MKKIVLLVLLIALSGVAYSKCGPTPKYVSQIYVESCSLIEGQHSLLIVGKEQEFFQIDEESPLPAKSIKRKNWEKNPLENYVMIANESPVSCGQYKKGIVIQVLKFISCCDVNPNERFECVNKTFSITDLPELFLNVDNI